MSLIRDYSKIALSLAGLALIAGLQTAPAQAASSPESEIWGSDVKDVNFKQVEGSGQGTLDSLMLTGNGSNDNSNNSGLNLDNANIDLPQGGGSPTAFAGSIWTTSWGELRDFYDQQFLYDGNGDGVSDYGFDNDGDGIVDVPFTEDDITMTIFFDVNEVGGDVGIEVEEIDIFTGVDFQAITGSTDIRDSPATNDITKTQQVADTPAVGSNTITRNALINNNDYYLRSLKSGDLDGNGTDGKLVGLNAQGNGIPDAVAVTGIKVYDSRFADSDNFVIWFKSSAHTSGGEDVFLSGDFLMADLNAGIPLPSSAASIALLIPLAMAWGYRRRRSSLSQT